MGLIEKEVETTIEGLGFLVYFFKEVDVTRKWARSRFCLRLAAEGG